MSIENVKMFYEVLSQDESLKQKFVEPSKKYQGQQMDEAKMWSITEEEVLPMAKQMGFSFTIADLKAYGEEMKQAKMNCELSDEEMTAVTGGNGLSFYCLIGGGGGGVVCVVIGANTDLDINHARFCFVIGGGS